MPDRFTYDNNDKYNPGLNKYPRPSDFPKDIDWPHDLDNKEDTLSRTKLIRYKFDIIGQQKINEINSKNNNNNFNTSVNNQRIQKKYIYNFKENNLDTSFPRYFNIENRAELKVKSDNNLPLTIIKKGKGYKKGDILQLIGKKSEEKSLKLRVTDVNANGGIEKFTLEGNGSNYAQGESIITKLEEYGYDTYVDCFDKCFNKVNGEDINTRGKCSAYIEETKYNGLYHDPELEMTKNIECVGDVIERIDSTRTDLIIINVGIKKIFRIL